MKRHKIALAGALLAALAAPAAVPAAAAPVATEAPRADARIISYGPHALQELDFYRAEGEGRRPLIVFVHGGAWAGGDKADSTGPAKIAHYTRAGHHFASINYRLLPEVAIEDQAADLAAAIAALTDSASTLDIDPRRIVLMGHSAGAHLAALVATDPRYLQAEGRSVRDIAGVVSIDAPALDVPAQIRDAGPLLGFVYQIGFGSALERQRALSPATHAAASPNAGRFLLLHVEQPDTRRQAQIFAAALTDAGTPALVESVEGKGMKGHNAINTRLGRSDFAATALVDQWLAELFAG